MNKSTKLVCDGCRSEGLTTYTSTLAQRKSVEGRSISRPTRSDMRRMQDIMVHVLQMSKASWKVVLDEEGGWGLVLRKGRSWYAMSAKRKGAMLSTWNNIRAMHTERCSEQETPHKRESEVSRKACSFSSCACSVLTQSASKVSDIWLVGNMIKTSKQHRRRFRGCLPCNAAKEEGIRILCRRMQ